LQPVRRWGIGGPGSNSRCWPARRTESQSSERRSETEAKMSLTDLMSRQSQVLRGLRAGLVAMCATAVYETTKQICFPRISVVQSHIVTIFFAGCVGSASASSFASGRGPRNRKLLRFTALVEQSDNAIISTELDGTVTGWNRGADGFMAILRPKRWSPHFVLLSAREAYGDWHFLAQDCQRRSHRTV